MPGSDGPVPTSGEWLTALIDTKTDMFMPDYSQQGYSRITIDPERGVHVIETYDHSRLYNHPERYKQVSEAIRRMAGLEP